MLWIVLSVVATALLCGAAALLPAWLRGKVGVEPAGAAQGRATAKDKRCAAVLFVAVWVFALCAYHRPGLSAGFDAFRFLAITALCGWAALCLVGVRVLRGVKRGVPVLALLAVVALGAELFVFNISYFNTHSYEPFQLFNCTDPGINAQIIDGRITLDEEHKYLRFININTPIYNLELDGIRNESTEPLEQNSLVTMKISVTDSANAALTDLNSWQVGLLAPRSHTISIDATGPVGTLALNITGYSSASNTYPVDFSITGITANARRPLAISPLRCFVVWLLLAAAYAVRPRSALWRRAWCEKALPDRLAAGALAAVLALAVAVVPFLQPGNTGLATKDYNTAFWDGESEISFVYQQYGALAHSLLNGRLDLEQDPPPELVAMENPYDVSARTEADIHGVLWDHALYNGRYYVYFGVVPCLLFQLPFEAITGVQNLAYAPCMVILGWLFLLGVFGALGQAVRRWFPKAPTAACLLGVTAIVAGSGLYSLLLRPYIYEYAIVAGATFVMLGLWQWLAAANTPTDHRRALLAHLALGSLCMALVAGCRPQMEFFAVLALPIFWPRYLGEKRLRSKAGAGELLAFLLPVVLVAAGLMAYNAARFGSPFDFGANYNLTGNDMTQRGWNPVRIGPAVFTSLLDLPRTMAVFPYLQEVNVQTNAMIRTISEKFLGGFLAATPFMWVCVAAAFRRGRKVLGGGDVRAVVLLALAGLAVITVVDCEMAGVLSRYMMDYSPVALLAAVLYWLAVYRYVSRVAADGVPLAHSCLRAVRLAMAAATGWSVAYRFCTLFAADPWMQGQNAALYYQTSRLIQFWM